jgi:hypothetical protein
MEQENMTRRTEGYLGKVRSASSGNEFSVFGVGENPDKGLSLDQTRSQLVGVFYVT